jgi:hypothetical protein
LAGEIKLVVCMNHFDFLAIQETKLVVVDDLCHSLWGEIMHGSGVSPQLWIIVDAFFLFGVMLRVNLLFPSLGRFLGWCLEWGAFSNHCFVVNIIKSDLY